MKRLLLLGGGHAHLHVLSALARAPIADVETVLVSPYPRFIYSGMLPGWVAGHYPLDACMVDLEALCVRARCELRQSKAVALDAPVRVVQCADGASVTYDVLSIDTGPETDLSAIDGAARHALPLRPLQGFVSGWQQIIAARTGNAGTVAVVGGGVGGVELALAMRYRLLREGLSPRAQVVLVSATAQILQGQSPSLRRMLTDELRKQDISVVSGQAVTAVTALHLQLANGSIVPARHAIFATGAAAPRWLSASGLATSAGGFIAIDECLRSTSHHEVFAAGDVASMARHPRPKSGVYAVRAGPTLAANLRRALSQQPLVTHVPQKRALYLVSTGERHAVAAWGKLSWRGRWVWRWKDFIDRRFVARYSG
jgi:pyridine nucleotide-disulfide oxidoreductase family protein